MNYKYDEWKTCQVHLPTVCISTCLTALLPAQCIYGACPPAHLQCMSKLLYCMYIYLSNCLITCLCTCLSVLLPVQYTFQYLSTCFTAYLSTRLPACLLTASFSVYLPAELLYDLSFCPSVPLIALSLWGSLQNKRRQPSSLQHTSLSQQQRPRGLTMSEHSGPVWP